jgi:HEAT repeat protein
VLGLRGALASKRQGSNPFELSQVNEVMAGVEPDRGPMTTTGQPQGKGNGGAGLVLALSAILLLAAPVLSQERWEQWWRYNKEPHLELKSRIFRPAVTEEVGFSLGAADADNIPPVIRPGRNRVEREVLPALRLAVADEYFGVRASAILSLGKIGEPIDRKLIERALRDEHVRVREFAVVALGILAQPESVATLVSIVKDDVKGRRAMGQTELQLRSRAYAVAMLGLLALQHEKSRPEVLEFLTRHINLDEKAPDIPVCSIAALGALGDERALPYLVDLLKNGNVNDLYRAYAVASMGQIGSRSVLSLLEKATADDDIRVCRSAIQALGIVGKKDDSRTIKILTHWARQGKEPIGQAWALLALGRIGGEEARKVLSRALETDQDWRKAYAALGLALDKRKNGAECPEAAGIHKLLRALEGDSVRAGLALSLGLLRYRSARFDVLDLAVARGDPGLKGNCAVALGLMEARDAIPQLKKSLDTRIDPQYQSQVAISLGLMSDPQVVPLLLRIMESATTQAQITSVVGALGTVGDETALEPLVAILANREKQQTVRAAAAAALGAVADERPFPPLHVFAVDANFSILIGSYRALLAIP